MSRGKLIALSLFIIMVGVAYYFFMVKPKADETAGTDIPVAATAEPAAAGDKTASAPSDAPAEYWTKRCNKDEPSYCEVFQKLIVKDKNQRLIEFAVGYPAAGKDAQAVIALPLGIVLEKGIALKVDDGPSASAPVHACNTEGCYSVMNVPAAFIDSMKNGKKITVAFLDGNSKQLNIELSLQGFGDRLSEVAK